MDEILKAVFSQESLAVGILIFIGIGIGHFYLKHWLPKQDKKFEAEVARAEADNSLKAQTGEALTSLASSNELTVATIQQLAEGQENLRKSIDNKFGQVDEKFDTVEFDIAELRKITNASKNQAEN